MPLSSYHNLRGHERPFAGRFFPFMTLAPTSAAGTVRIEQ